MPMAFKNGIGSLLLEKLYRNKAKPTKTSAITDGSNHFNPKKTINGYKTNTIPNAMAFTTITLPLAFRPHLQHL